MRPGVPENWSTQLRKGILELCVLNACRGDAMYGYDIVRRLRAIRGLMIREGTVYPILNRLKREGLLATEIVESREGPARKYYRLTPAGSSMLSAMNEHWKELIEGIDALVQEKPS